MIGLNLFKKASPAAIPEASAPLAAPFIAPKNLDEIAELFESIGLLDAENFKEAVLEPASYSGGSLEWSEEDTDMRFIVEGWCGGRVYRVWATPLKGAVNYRYSNELIAGVNKRVTIALFS